MGETDYATYLRINALLELQQPLSPGAHDEMLFIVVHQAFELWFKVILHELDAVRDALFAGELGVAVSGLRRVTEIHTLLAQQLRVIETMSPEGFMAFRDPLAPASGFQSSQFREIEILGGTENAAVMDALHLDEQQRERLLRRLGERNLWDGLCAALERHALPMPPADQGDARETRTASLVSLYHDHAAPERALLHQICELLVDHDEAIAVWRYHHMLMAAREIGRRQGTGGSAGVAYLQSTLTTRFFPELWAVRTAL